jgi:glycosyltransferase involved in cell wall biosynthesis
MYYPPNVEGVHWFATDVFPQVRRTQPGTTFQVVGSRPPVSITRLAIPKSGVDVMGYVDDLTSVYANSGVVVVPVRSGSGMRVKILEAFARGIPVVSTSMGVEGIDAEDGKHLLIADNARSFADAVIQILRQPHVAARLAHAARDLVERRYDWRTALNDLDEIYPAVERRPVPAIDGSR